MPQSSIRKVAIVTGGARGIGAAVVRGLVGRGMAVVIADLLDGEPLAASIRAEGGEAAYCRTDISRAGDVAAMVAAAREHFGGLDALVNCAGIFPRASLLETSEAMWDQIMDVNLKGVFLACQAAVPLMTERGGGAIVNIGSLHAAGGGADLMAYATSKGGVVTLTRNLARALAQHRIRVNCVHPGWVASEGEVALRRSQGYSEAWLEEQGARMPLGRLQTPEDVANAVLFFVADESSQVTGQSIAVDGGASLGR